MLESSEWTSANPTHTNTFIQANAVDNPDFEIEIKELMKEQKETVVNTQARTLLFFNYITRKI